MVVFRGGGGCFQKEPHTIMENITADVYKARISKAGQHHEGNN